MPTISTRVQGFTDSVIRRMTRISDRHDAINLSQGFPDFDPPQAILEELQRVAKAGPHQYAVTYGAADFRKALAEKQQRFAGVAVNPETDIVVTCGGTEAMIAAMMTVCNPGDQVIVFSPFYENYAADAILSGASPLYVPLLPPDFRIDRPALEVAFLKKPKALILCNPSNPCGKVFTLEELQYIASLAIRHDAFVITDEVYEHIVYAPHRHLHMAALPGMAERTLTCSSLSKTYSITGWRLGYLIGPAEVIDAARRVHDFLTIGAAAPLQQAAVIGLQFPDSYYEELGALYEGKQAHFLKGLDAIGLPHNEPEGAYFVLVDVQDILKQPRFAGFDDLKLCEWMIVNLGVAAVPGSSFFRSGGQQYIRLHFAREKATLDEALRRLGGLLA